MNEQNWYDCKSPKKLMNFIQHDRRRLRLLLAAWLRECMPTLYEDEQFYHSDDSTHLWAAVAALESGSRYSPPSVRDISDLRVHEVVMMCRILTDTNGDPPLPVLRASDIMQVTKWLSHPLQADIFRTMFAPPWLDLNIPLNNDALSLAAAAYDTQEHLCPSLTSILADALEDAGCVSPHIIQPLRGKVLRYPGGKWETAATWLYRGMFVIERILGQS